MRSGGRQVVRLWTIHPRYLDTKGILAAWREGLLAQKVLSGGTRGYRNHPQLDRFKDSGRALDSIAVYLADIQTEAARRGYSFDASRIGTGREQGSTAMTESTAAASPAAPARIAVPAGQIEYEFELLKAKLEVRDRAKLAELSGIATIELNAAFTGTNGGIAPWERPLAAVLGRIGISPG
jgi:hypothetical protein